MTAVSDVSADLSANSANAVDDEATGSNASRKTYLTSDSRPELRVPMREIP